MAESEVEHDGHTARSPKTSAKRTRWTAVVEDADHPFVCAPWAGLPAGGTFGPGVAFATGAYCEEASRPGSGPGGCNNVRRWSVMAGGGHFAPAGEPQRVARGLAACF